MGKLILSYLIPILFVVGGTVLLRLLWAVIAPISEKFHLDWVLNYEVKVDDWINVGLADLEQKSISAVGAGQPTTPTEENIIAVIKFVNDQLTSHGLPEKAADALAKYINAKLSAKLGVAPAVMASRPLNG
jgi:hypothetical protein